MQTLSRVLSSLIAPGSEGAGGGAGGASGGAGAASGGVGAGAVALGGCVDEGLGADGVAAGWLAGAAVGAGAGASWFWARAAGTRAMLEMRPTATAARRMLELPLSDTAELGLAVVSPAF
jgi:hypothetical protein